MKAQSSRTSPEMPASPFVDIPTDAELRWVLRRWENGLTNDDAYFDRIYPEWAQALSRVHWTPLPVIRRAVELLLEDRPQGKILDIGSGAGKFCLAGATISQGRFLGVEQRPRFIALCRKLATHYAIPRVTFIQGNMLELPWDGYDGVYLFNPFQEHKTPFQRIDSTIDLDRTFFERYVEHVEHQLERLPSGARVVTYHGFGGRIPASYRCITKEFCFRGPLECWEQR